MQNKFEIILEFIKDLSVETPDAETLIFVKKNISSYQMNIDITSIPLKNKAIEVNTKIIFKDNSNNNKKSFFEIVYATVIKLDDNIKDKSEIEKIILCDVQLKIYPKLEKIFLNLLKDSGFPGIKFEKKVDFEKLYNDRIS
jgi:Preprotein translocase subunit SecB|tara:strand:+ start:228 stop:650 length:423 start_codon:yes stop_codon:yes gene_type:complete